MTIAFDVLIVGGGLAGATLARQLRREVPQASIVVIERRAEPGYKVGESLVEIGTDYLVRRLGLARHLYENHLPKNGLRFFFDTEQRDTALPQMSEIGSDALPFHPSFQIDRSTLERALLDMNERDGVQVRRETRVVRILPGAPGRLHEVVVQDGAREQTLSARWLVDATGRARLLQKTLQTPRVECDHPIAAAWSRLQGVVDIDTLGGADWRRRVRHTSRHLSTNHLCYPGYWIWFIPLRSGVVSVGWVGERSLFDETWRRSEGLLAHLRAHRSAAQLLEAAEPLDALSLGQLAYGTSWFLRPKDRLALTGEAAAFSDPFYSPGSDFIALENDFITDLVRRDLAGEPDQEWAQRGLDYDAFLQFRFDATMLLYRELYPLLGSRELLELKWVFDIGCYYNLWLDAYLRDQHLEHRWVKDQLARRDFVLAGLRNFSALFRSVEQTLRQRGAYFRGNTDTFAPGLRDIEALVPLVGTERPRKQQLRATASLFNQVLRRAKNLMGETSPTGDLPLFEFMLEQPAFVSASS